MGKVIVKIKLTNYSDLVVRRLKLGKGKPRAVEVEALVDTGATRLYLKPSVIKKLGLVRTDTVRSQTTNGDSIRYKYEPVELELMGRRESFDFNPYWVRVRLAELPDGRTNLSLFSHGRNFEFGHLLNHDERREFAKVLERALSSARGRMLPGPLPAT